MYIDLNLVPRYLGYGPAAAVLQYLEVPRQYLLVVTKF